MKVFLDANVLISALTTHGLCHDLVARLLDTEAHQPVVSEQVINEVARILEDKFDRPIKAFPFASELLRRLSRVADDPSFDGANIPDPDDVPIIGAALAGQVDVFITGDKALLALEAIGAMRIAAPRAAWDLVFSA